MFMIVCVYVVRKACIFPRSIVIVVSKTKEEDEREDNYRYQTMLNVFPWHDPGYPVPQQGPHATVGHAQARPNTWRQLILILIFLPIFRLRLVRNCFNVLELPFVEVLEESSR